MRDALVITLSLIIAFVILGYAYNLMQPYLVKLEIIEKPNEEVGLKPDGGVFRSIDFGRTWEQKTTTEKGTGFEKSNVFTLEFSPNDPQVIYAATSKGLFSSQDSANTWQAVFQETLAADEAALAFAIDVKNPQRMYIAAYLHKRGGRILKAKGAGFYEVYSTMSLENRVTGLWIDPFDPSVVYAGTSSGALLISNDFGESWRIQHNFINAIYDLAMAPSDTRIIYLASGGKIFKTIDQGKSWQDISPRDWQAKQGALIIQHIAINPYSEGEIYVATGEGLVRSRNGGASFEPISLPVANQTLDVSALYLSSLKEHLIFIGVGSQIYKSDDAGVTWRNQNLNTSRKINVIASKPDDSVTIFVGLKQ